MNYTEIVKKLIGNIQPAGASHIDPERFKNLKEMCELVNNLVIEIDKVVYDNKHAQQHSIKEMVEYAEDFINNTLRIES